MLSVRGLTVRFGATVAVDDVSFVVPDGSVLALLGPSGCGKSTLLRAIAGTEQPAAGRIAWDGVDLARIPLHRRGFGLMFQDGVLFPHRSVAGNVGYGLRGRPGAHERVAELLDMVGLAGYQDRRVATLSGGEAQRVALARALAPNPRLLLLDEPLAALDRALRSQLLVDLADVLARTRTTAIFVTHDQDEAFAIADRIALMRAGALVQVAAPRTVWRFPTDEAAAAFLGCEAVVAGRPTLGEDGRPCTATVLGAVPGSAERIGVRASALVVDDAGPLGATVLTSVAGPERRHLTVRIDGIDGVDGTDAVAGGAPAAPSPDGSARPDLPTGPPDPPTGRPATALPAIAPAGARCEPGAHIRLRFDADRVALIGAKPPAGPVVVAGAIVHGDRLLAARRQAPPALAGKWELPGGKVEDGESETAALARELAEELGIAVDVGPRIGAPVPLDDASGAGPRAMHVYRVGVRAGKASYSVHDQLRWVGSAELADLDWAPADLTLLPELRRVLADGHPGEGVWDSDHTIVP